MKLTDKLLHFHLYVKQSLRPAKEDYLSHTDHYQIKYNQSIQMGFSNVEAIMLLFLSLMVTDSSGEMSFSRLNRIKHLLRTTMSQGRLSALSILCIESDNLRQTDCDELLDDFAMKKTRIFYFCLNVYVYQFSLLLFISYYII